MTLNLARPWSVTCAPPFTPDLRFATHRDDFLLAGSTGIDIVCQAGMHALFLDWTLARNGFATPFARGRGEDHGTNGFRVRLATDGLHPGFYDLRVKVDTGLGEPIEGICTFGWEVDRMAITDSRPEGFRAFWQEALAEVRETPPDPVEAPLERFDAAAIAAYNLAAANLPADYDPEGHAVETVLSGKVNLAAPGGRRVYGWLARPDAEGPFPAMLVLPGAGNAARPRPLEHARHGYVVLDLQVHGYDVDLPAYEELPPEVGAMDCAPEQAGYRRIYQRVLQAVEYLLARPDVDGRLVTAGGSQGGRLALVAAGVHPGVNGVVAGIPHFANQPWQAWVQACNRAGLDGMDRPAPPMPTGREGRTTAWFDTMNFAPDIYCPVLLNVGLCDPVSPPSGVQAIYRRLASEVRGIDPIPGLGHDWSAAFDRRAWRWLRQHLPAPATTPAG